MTGIALLFVPAMVIDLLLGGDASQVGLALARVLGIALISLGVRMVVAVANPSGILPAMKTLSQADLNGRVPLSPEQQFPV